jgi:hypothetical protein
VETALPHDVTVSVDWIFQWRESLQDGVYAVPGFLIRAADGSRARYVGHRPGTEIRWQANRHLWFQADYGIFYAGTFLKQTRSQSQLLGLVGRLQVLERAAREKHPLYMPIYADFPWVLEQGKGIGRDSVGF